MARKKKVLKAKEPIRLRSKLLANGSQSLYLDQYDPVTQKRKYEFLKLYIVPETSEAARVQNQNTLQNAENIKAQRIIDLNSKGTGVRKNAVRSKILLIDWLRLYSKRKLETGRSPQFSRQVDNMINHVVKYGGDKIALCDVDSDFCEGFIEHLSKVKTKTGQNLAKSTQHAYYKRLFMALKWAVSQDLILVNPAAKVDRTLVPKMPESKREFLDVSEVKRLIETPCNSKDTKRAYLFACFCGLRCSDIRALTWKDIVTRNGQKWIEIVMQKTNRPIALPLSDEALGLIPERGEASDTDKVFSLPSKQYINRALRIWAKEAGITKYLTFHTSRHTFATLGLTAGTDLYTVSKLLGHQDVKTTQVYAKLVDEKKREGVNKLSGLFH